MLENQYNEFEQTINIQNGDFLSYSSLPRFNGNKFKPIHRWFTYKEGFSSELLPWVCQRAEIQLSEIESFLDPFCGVGTSLVSAQTSFQGSQQLLAVGIERNPFIAFVARAKTNWPLY